MSTLAWRTANPEKTKASNAAWRAANSEKKKAYDAARYAANREKYAAYQAARYPANREKKKAYQTARYKANPEKYTEYGRKHRYGVTEETFQKIFLLQSGTCKICGLLLSVSPGARKTDRPNIDHCHTTGKIRGLLCGKCNMALGLFKDSAENLEKAKQYLEEFKDQKELDYSIQNCMVSV